MKKTISINLNSFIFNIDEDAYNKLRKYLDKLELYFSGSEGGGEIIRDIEARIAEIFSMKITENKQVINETDVDEVISILGDVEDIVGDNEQVNQKKEKKKYTKKLYRDTDNKILGGVCAGLAAYTGLDVVVWRIIFIALLFVPVPISIVLYLILWIIVPEAKTIAQKIEMKGEKIDLSHIEKTVKEEYEEVKKKLKDVDTNKFSSFLNNVGNTILEILTIIVKIFGKIIGIVATIAGVALIIALIAVVIGIVFGFVPFNILELSGVPLNLINFSSPVFDWIFTISLILFILIPVITIIYWGIKLLFGVKGNKHFGISTFVLWLVCLVFLIATALWGSTSFIVKDRHIVTETIEIRKDKPIYHISINEGKQTYHNNIKSIIKHYTGSEYLELYPRINFDYTEDTVLKIKFNYTSRGNDHRKIKEKIQSIKYDYTITDTITYLDQFYMVPKKDWSFQNLKIDILVPIGYQFQIDENMLKMVNYNSHIINDPDEIYEATENGFTVIGR